MKENQHPQSDLLAIDGIGPRRLGWLHDELGITSRGELAALTADELGARFRANNRSVPRSLIESWIAQAQAHTAGAPDKDAVAAGGTDTAPAAAPAPHEQVPLPRAGETSQVAVMLVGVRIFQPAKTAAPCIHGTPAQLIAWPVIAHEPFTLDALCETTGPAPGHSADYKARFFARDLSTGQKMLLGESKPAVGEPFQRLTLAGARLPPGLYRIQIAVTRAGAQRVDHLELPLLRVA